jgi:amino acid transporter
LDFPKSASIACVFGKTRRRRADFPRSACSSGERAASPPPLPSCLFTSRAEITFFGEIATLGTILIALTYLVANLALPVYFHRYHPDRFSPVLHLVLPLLGAAAIGYPLYELIKPGQPAPFSHYPLIAGGVIVVALLYGAIVYGRDRTLGERVGSVVADAD